MSVSGRATKAFEADLKQLSVSTKTSAEAQVAASLKRTSRLREEAAAYHSLASTARRGSSEQVAAANLAARADKRLASSLGVTSHEAAKLRASASGVERDLGRATRGALAGSGIFRGLGRSLAFASGGFLAFASAGQVIRTSIDAAREAAVTQRQMAQQFRASGDSLANYQERISQTTLKLSALSGFTKDTLDQSFTTLYRNTGNVTQALKLTALAADVARGRHMDLEKAAILVGKVAGGNTSLLRRYGLEIAKGATATQGLALLTQKYSGQARAGATEAQRFDAILHDSEVIIGQGILPTLNRYLASGGKWLAQMNESGQLQKDVTGIAKGFGRAMHDVSVVVRDLVGGFRLLNETTGSAENTVKILGAAFIGLKLRKFLVELGLVRSGIFGIGTASTVAAGEVNVLTAAEGRAATGAVGVAAAGASGVVLPAGVRSVAGGAGGAAGVGAGAAAGAGASLLARGGAIAARAASLAAPVFVLGGGIKKGKIRFQDGWLEGSTDGVHWSKMQYVGFKQAAGPPLAVPFAFQNPNPDPKGKGPFAGLPKGSARSTVGSLQGQFNLAEFRLAQAQLTKRQTDDRKILELEARITREQIKQAKSLADKTKYTQQLVGILGQIKGIDDSIAAREKAQAAAAKARRDKIAAGGVSMPLQLAQARADAIAAGSGATALTKGQITVAKEIRAAEYKAIRSHKLSMQGLIDAWSEIGSINQQLQGAKGAFGGIPLKLQLAEAKADARAAAQGATSLTAGQTTVLKEIRAAEYKAIRSHKLSMQGLIDAWNEIASINQQLATSSKGSIDTYHAVSTRAITAGMGLTRDQRLALEERIAQRSAHRGYVPSGPAALGQGITFTGPVTINGVQNVDQLEKELRKKARQRAASRTAGRR